MKVKCINKKCNHIWDYRGKSKSYICCPKCSYRFKIQRGIEEYSKTMLTYSHNIPNNIVNIVKEELLFERVILNEGMEVLVEKRIAKQFKESPEDLDEEIECVMDEEESEEMPTIAVKICEYHGLPARYDSFEKKWVCEECNPIPINKRYKLVTDNLWIVKKIKKDIDIRILPAKTPLEIIEYQRSFR